jgi:EAL and modified HD-GYP domain-containing signal transduction protein
MQTAIARGRFMEIIAASRFPPQQHDNLFIVGAFSLLDILFGAPLGDILAEIDLPTAITAALTQRSGEFAPLLALALACEKRIPRS